MHDGRNNGGIYLVVFRVIDYGNDRLVNLFVDTQRGFILKEVNYKPIKDTKKIVYK